MKYINRVELQGMTPAHAQAITYQGKVVRIDFRLRIEMDAPQLQGVDNIHSAQHVTVRVLTMPGYATEDFIFLSGVPIRITGMYINGAIEANTAEYLDEEED